MEGTPAALALAIVLSIAGCDRSPPPVSTRADASTQAAVARAAAPSAEAHPLPAAAASASSSSAAGAPGACAGGRWLAGKIGSAAAFARVSRAGQALTGSYFYEKPGTDLALEGSVEGGHFKLVERVGGKTTGELTGECQAGDKLVGTWSSPDGKRTRPFSFSVPDRITIATRRVTFTSKSKVPSDGVSGEGDCEYALETPIVLGARSREVEERIAAAIAAADSDLLDPTYERDARACDATKDGWRLAYFNAGFTVVRQDEAMLVLEFSGALNSVPSAHPTNYAGATVVNLDVATGRVIAAADVVTDEKRVLDLAAGCSSGDLGSDLVDASPAYLFLKQGVRVVGTSYGHAAAVMTFHGPEISYRALLRERLLQPDSPIAREWAREKPAPAGESPCRARFTPP